MNSRFLCVNMLISASVGMYRHIWTHCSGNVLESAATEPLKRLPFVPFSYLRVAPEDSRPPP